MKIRMTKPTMRELMDLGVSQPYSSELAAGKKLPSLKLAQKVEDALGYPAGAWRLISA